MVRKDGRPHVAPIWFVLDGEDVIFATAERTVKGHAIRRDPRVVLCIDDERPPFAFVRIEGEASVSCDQEEMLHWIGARYMGADRGEEFGRRNAVAGELLVRVAVTRIFRCSTSATRPLRGASAPTFRRIRPTPPTPRAPAQRTRRVRPAASSGASRGRIAPW